MSPPQRLVVIGNSGAGKSTLAKRLSATQGLAHLDLDTLAWLPEPPPRRRPLSESAAQMDVFFHQHAGWVVEGSYADLAALALPRCSRLLFLDPGVEVCVHNARSRPWEPHKYPSKEAQDANLELLVSWIRDYPHRDDTFSRRAHQALFLAFPGEKQALTSMQAIAGYPG